MYSENKKIKQFVFLAAIILAFYFLPALFKTLFAVFLPFIAAWVFAHILYAPSEYISEKMHIPKGISCVFSAISFFALVFTGAYLVLSKLMGELSGLSLQLMTATEKIPLFVEKAKLLLSDFLPFIDIGENTDIIKNTLSGFALSLAEKMTSFVSIAFVFVPKIVLGFFVTVIATCYFTKDLKCIKRFFACQLPEKSRAFITESKNQLVDTFSRYTGAYLTIALITFAELFAGLMFIKREYAFILAIVITVVDILPIFGSGAVLLPWAATEYLFKNSVNGTKILVLYILITAVRQMIEPKIVGDFIGLYPLTALFCVFAGGMTMGFAGIFIFPVCAILIKNLNEKGLLRLYKTPPENTKEKISVAREKYKRFRKT